MKKYEVKAALFISIGIGVCSLHSIIAYFFPETKVIQYDLWLGNSYHKKISVEWYMYEMEQILAWCLCFYGMANFVRLVSYRLFNFLFIIYLYFITQLLLYVWNRNTLFCSNLIIYLYMAIAIIALFLPGKKGGKLINIEGYQRRI